MTPVLELHTSRMDGLSQLPSGDPSLDSDSSPDFISTADEGAAHRSYLLNTPTSFVLNSVDTSVQEYIAQEGFGALSRRYRCLLECMEAEPELSIDLATIFWATQHKQEQLDFWNLSATFRLSSNQNRLLCAKCGKWILAHDFPAHLNTEQLIAVSRSPPGWELEDASPGRRRSGGVNLSNDKFLFTTQLREFHLRQPDWPAICPICHCVVMMSYMRLHRSHINFCKQS